MSSLSDADYDVMARALEPRVAEDLLRLGRGARQRLARDRSLCVKVGRKLELTSRGYILRSALIRGASAPAH